MVYYYYFLLFIFIITFFLISGTSSLDATLFLVIMDLVYMRDNPQANGTTFRGHEFIEDHPGVAIPYLILLTIATVSGCIGNCMVIATVMTNKVM